MKEIDPPIEFMRVEKDVGSSIWRIPDMRYEEPTHWFQNQRAAEKSSIYIYMLYISKIVHYNRK